MIRYYIHLWVSIILAATTWLAIYNPVSEKYSVLIAITACAFSAAIEFTGYLLYRDYERTENTASLVTSILILLASATFTFWGAELMRSYIVGAAVEESEQQYVPEINNVNSQIAKYEAGQLEKRAEFTTSVNARINELKNERKEEIIRVGASKNFTKDYLNGNAAWYRRQDNRQIKGWIKQADSIWEKYQLKIEDARNAEFKYNKPNHLYKRLEDLKSGKEDFESRAQDSASIVSNTIKVADIILLVFALYIMLSSFTSTAGPYVPRNPISEHLVNAALNLKESAGRKLAMAFQAYDESLINQQEQEYIYESGYRARSNEVKDELDELFHLRNEVRELHERLVEMGSENKELTHSLARVEKASREAEWRASVAEQKLSVYTELADNQQRVEVSGNPSSNASGGMKKLSVVEYEGRTYKNIESFKGSMRSKKSKAEREGDEGLWNEYLKMKTYYDENFSQAKIKRIG